MFIYRQVLIALGCFYASTLPAISLQYDFAGILAGGAIEEIVIDSQSRFAVGDAFTFQVVVDTGAPIGTPSAAYRQAEITSFSFQLNGSNPAFSPLVLNSGTVMTATAVTGTVDTLVLGVTPDQPEATFTSPAPRISNMANESTVSRISVLLDGDSTFLNGNPVEYPTSLNLGDLFPYASIGDSTELRIDFTSSLVVSFPIRGVLQSASVSVVPESAHFGIFFGIVIFSIAAGRRTRKNRPTI